MDLFIALWEYSREPGCSMKNKKKTTLDKCCFQLTDAFLYNLQIILIESNHSSQQRKQ